VRLVLATRNDHKLRELAELLRPFELDPLPGDVTLPPETGTTFADNALGKARAAAAATGRPAVADDSGIEAAALGGAPGVWSARFAGEDATVEENLAKLLRDVPDDGDRRVAYVCALAYVEPGGREELVQGRCEGTLAAEPRGSGGFGYDPAFVPDDYPGDERTMAELTPEEKDAISHRGRAARALVVRLLEAAEMERPAGPLRALLGGLGGPRASRGARPTRRHGRGADR
jgi:XTP/dITP diphosphohydrolase